MKDTRIMLVSNWKTYVHSKGDAVKIFAQRYSKVTHIICPPHSFFTIRTTHSHHLGAQDVDESGETGNTTAEILKSFGVTHCIVGHAERRSMGETNSTIQKKITHLARYGIIPILCIGETNKKTRNRTLSTQLRVLRDFSRDNIIIAYEPVYAIGAKSPAQTNDIVSAVAYIKQFIEKRYSTLKAKKILYGGSVNANTASSILKSTGVDGLLVGRASIDIKSMRKLYHAIC